MILVSYVLAVIFGLFICIALIKGGKDGSDDDFSGMA